MQRNSASNLDAHIEKDNQGVDTTNLIFSRFTNCRSDHLRTLLEHPAHLHITLRRTHNSRLGNPKLAALTLDRRRNRDGLRVISRCWLESSHGGRLVPKGPAC